MRQNGRDVFHPAAMDENARDRHALPDVDDLRIDADHFSEFRNTSQDDQIGPQGFCDGQGRGVIQPFPAEGAQDCVPVEDLDKF